MTLVQNSKQKKEEPKFDFVPIGNHQKQENVFDFTSFGQTLEKKDEDKMAAFDDIVNIKN